MTANPMHWGLNTAAPTTTALRGSQVKPSASVTDKSYQRDLRDREVYECVIRFTEETLVADGLDAVQAAKLGMKVAELLRKDWGGQKIYFSKAEELELQVRDLDIYNRFHGRREEASALAKEFHLSEERIRQIVSMVTARELAMRQGGLF